MILIIAITENVFERWQAVGQTRDDADRLFADMLASSTYARPLYRVVASPKADPRDAFILHMRTIG